MNYDIQLRFAPSEAFVGILAELNEQYADWVARGDAAVAPVSAAWAALGLTFPTLSLD